MYMDSTTEGKPKYDDDKLVFKGEGGDDVHKYSIKYDKYVLAVALPHDKHCIIID